MGIVGIIIKNCTQDMVYFLGRNLWEYNMINFKNAYNAIYYSVKYTWIYREKIKKEIIETWDKHNLTWKIQNTIYSSIPQITYNK